MMIVTGAVIFGHFLAVTRIPHNLATWVGTLPLPPIAIMVLIIFIYLIGGCFIDSLALVMLTVPIFYPIVTSLSFSSIWFGVIIVMVTQVGVISPPLATNVFIMKGVAKDIPLNTIFKGVYPFIAAVVICITAVMIFPGLATYLPGLMK